MNAAPTIPDLDKIDVRVRIILQFGTSAERRVLVISVTTGQS